ncbi:MAG: radical SAM protein [Nitrososphaerota archaeon]|jgi:biotin synthase|nr:radical SAM protein [Nitrososphaerota archaeon]
MSTQNLPVQLRVSIGTAISLDLIEGKMDVTPATAYLMTFTEGKCLANCNFCPQAQESKSNTNLLSRVSWPAFPTFVVVAALNNAIKKGNIKRVCIQVLNVPNVFLHVDSLVREIKKNDPGICVSVSCQPLNSENILLLKKAGVDRIGIALDAASEAIFRHIKGVEGGGIYNWHQELGLLEEALLIFGQGKVSTHLIAGLGETEQEIVCLIQWCVDKGILPALFAFTPIKGTPLEKHSPPNIESYRRLQLARYMLVQGITCFKHLTFNTEGQIVLFGVDTTILDAIVNSGLPFQTSGCPNCNRPFYNEKPSGPLYNYPKNLNQKELDEVKRQLNIRPF